MTAVFLPLVSPPAAGGQQNVETAPKPAPTLTAGSAQLTLKADTDGARLPAGPDRQAASGLLWRFWQTKQHRESEV